MDGRTAQLRETFDAVAERYDRVRPGYPRPTVEDLEYLAALQVGSRVLEIGCGTGQLTVPLARLGTAVTAVELGAALADVARRNMAAYPNVQVVVGAFEEVALAEAAFDLVVAATSFHWIDPATRLRKSARVLRRGGFLAVIDTHHIAGGTDQFFLEVQRHYEKWDPTTPPGLRLQGADAIPVARPDLEEPALFGPALLRRYEWEAEYTTSEYLALLLTYSNHLALPAPQQDGLISGIGSLIDTRFGGIVRKRYLTELRVIPRRTTPCD
jgi:ubiquinone/menaquinone biosynthesis C-methylase UbiE